jgi:Ca-activated chloride channel family protein
MQNPSNPNRPSRAPSLALAGLALALLALPAAASGSLTPLGSVEHALRIQDHHVDVVLNNGFARVEVSQTFFNPNGVDLEALYAFPVPEGASLSEMTIFVGEDRLDGEVVEKDRARRIYEQETAQGNEAGLAEKRSYLRYEFRVFPVRAQAETSFRFVYYEPLEIDAGVGEWVYPLEEGGTDVAADRFWTTNKTVERSFSMNVAIRSAVPLDAVRMPGHDAAAQVTQHGPGDWELRLDSASGSLERDVLVYYKLAEELPGRIEVIPYKAGPDETGTYMMVVTPGIDLAPLDGGADYVFVLDTSGSMEGKLHTLAKGMSKVLGQMRPQDRVRVIAFSAKATELTRGWTACSLANVTDLIDEVQGLQTGGSTDLHAGLRKALDGLDDDRATSIVIVTDGVTNSGVVSPAAFHELLSTHDVRVFGFLMGNSANWPLMRTICDASGGFYKGVSNASDIVGQILLAKSKVLYECLHDARLTIRGVPTYDATGEDLGKVYRGQQLVAFGRYDQPGRATVSLAASLTGEDKVYSTTFDFPEVAVENPEIERLWAMDRIEDIQHRMDIGEAEESEGGEAIAHLGVAYQLVTDETSMVVLSEQAYARHGIERNNLARVAREVTAQATKAAEPVRNYRIDEAQPAFPSQAPRPKWGGGGGGAVDPFTLALAAGAALWGLRRRRRAGAAA